MAIDLNYKNIKTINVIYAYELELECIFD